MMSVRVSLFEAVCALVSAKLPAVEVDDVHLSVDGDGCVVVDLVPRATPPKKLLPTLDDIVDRGAYETSGGEDERPRLPKASRVRPPEPLDLSAVDLGDEEEEAGAAELQASTAARRDRPWFRPVPKPNASRIRQQDDV